MLCRAVRRRRPIGKQHHGRCCPPGPGSLGSRAGGSQAAEPGVRRLDVAGLKSSFNRPSLLVHKIGTIAPQTAAEAAAEFGVQELHRLSGRGRIRQEGDLTTHLQLRAHWVDRRLKLVPCGRGLWPQRRSRDKLHSHVHGTQAHLRSLPGRSASSSWKGGRARRPPGGNAASWVGGTGGGPPGGNAAS